MSRVTLTTQIETTIYPNVNEEIDAQEHQDLLKAFLTEAILDEDLGKTGTGTTIALDNKGGTFYGTATAPITGNLTVDPAKLKVGGFAEIVHNDGAEPNIANATKDPGFTYAPNTINTIIIKFYGNGYVSALTARQIQPSGGITAIVQDTTPQLGGDLDLNNFSINGITPLEISYLDGVTSPIQQQISGLQPIAEKNTPNGYLGADANGNLPITRLDGGGATEGQAPIWNESTGRFEPGDVSDGGLDIKIGAASAVPASTFQNKRNISYQQDGSTPTLFYPYWAAKIVDSYINNVTPHTITIDEMFSYYKVAATINNSVHTMPDLATLPDWASIFICHLGHQSTLRVTLNAHSGQVFSSDIEEQTSQVNSFQMGQYNCYLFVKKPNSLVWQVAWKSKWKTTTVDNTSPQTEETASINNNICAVNASTSEIWQLSASTDFTVAFSNLEENQSITIRKSGIGRLKGVTQAGVNTIKFSGGENQWVNTTQTSDDWLVFTRQGSHIVVDINNLNTVPNA